METVVLEIAIQDKLQLCRHRLKITTTPSLDINTKQAIVSISIDDISKTTEKASAGTNGIKVIPG